MRFLLASLVIVLAVLGIAVVGLPYLVPQDWLKSQVAAQIESATGRQVTITGDTRVQVLPTLAARLGGLEVANAPGFAEPHLLRTEGVAAELALWPLIERRIEVRRFVVSGLDLRLEVDAEGHPNWVFEPATGRAETAPSAAESPAAETGDGAPGDGLGATPAVTLGDVRLEGGSVRFGDARTGTVRMLDQIDGIVAMEAADQPLALDVTASLDARPIALELRLATPDAVMAGHEASLAFTLTGDGLETGFDGTVRAGAAPRVAGTLDLGVDAASSTLGWLAGNPVDLPVDAFALDGQVDATRERVVLDTLGLSADAIAGEGRLEVALAAARPAVAGVLAFGPVDLGAFMDGAPPQGTGGDGAGGDAGGATASGGDHADPGGWPTDQIVFAPLPVDLDVAVTFERLTVPPLNLGAGAVHLGGSDGALVVTLEQLGFYGGDAGGTLTLEPRDDGIAIANDVTLGGFSTGPLLRDLTGNGFLGGAGTLTLEAQAEGGSVQALVGALDGRGRLDIGRAVLEGLAGRPELEALRVLLALGGEPGAPLRLADVGASFTITDGIVANDDLQASTAAIRLNGSGTVDLPQQRVPRYTVTPEVTGALGVIASVQPFALPLVLEGPFDRLTVRPAPKVDSDLEGAAETIIDEGLGGVLRGLGISR